MVEGAEPHPLRPVWGPGLGLGLMCWGGGRGGAGVRGEVRDPERGQAADTVGLVSRCGSVRTRRISEQNHGF